MQEERTANSIHRPSQPAAADAKASGEADFRMPRPAAQRAQGEKLCQSLISAPPAAAELHLPMGDDASPCHTVPGTEHHSLAPMAKSPYPPSFQSRFRSMGEHCQAFSLLLRSPDSILLLFSRAQSKKPIFCLCRLTRCGRYCEVDKTRCSPPQDFLCKGTRSTVPDDSAAHGRNGRQRRRPPPPFSDTLRGRHWLSGNASAR